VSPDISFWANQTPTAAALWVKPAVQSSLRGGAQIVGLTLQDRQRELKQFRREYAKGRKLTQYLTLTLRVLGISVLILCFVSLLFLGLMKVSADLWVRLVPHLPNPSKVALVILVLMLIRARKQRSG
jgi:sterol desaturase/sphingolipid hydroxylase (fatty acid hydroxylase superfamily)